jgi:CcmD family protein
MQPPVELATGLANLSQMTLSVPMSTGATPADLPLPTPIVQAPQTDFVPASQLPTEVLPATPFVFIAYAFVWVALIGYLFGLWRKLTRVERELAQVASRVEGRRKS